MWQTFLHHLAHWRAIIAAKCKGCLRAAAAATGLNRMVIHLISPLLAKHCLSADWHTSSARAPRNPDTWTAVRGGGLCAADLVATGFAHGFHFRSWRTETPPGGGAQQRGAGDGRRAQAARLRRARGDGHGGGETESHAGVVKPALSSEVVTKPIEAP
mgnify:CR=1 FL=1